MYICSINWKLIFGSILLCTVLCSCSKSQNTEGGLLWEISGNGLQESSYLFGTHHGMNGDFLDSISGFYDALDSVKQIAVESENGRQKKLDTIKPIDIFLPADIAYCDLLDESELKVLDSVLLIYFNVNSENIRLNPNALSVNLQTRMIRKESQIWAKTNPFMLDVNLRTNIDSRLIRIAKSRFLPIIELDSEEELDRLGLTDMSILFSSDDLQNKAKEMVSSIKEFKEDTFLMYRVKKIKEAYLEQNITLLEEWDIHPKIFKDEKTKSIYYKVTIKRNIFWMPKILTSIKEYPTLIMVGATHLPGNKGVINLLRNEGYIVKSVH
jgi:uncharacterized protein